MVQSLLLIPVIVGSLSVGAYGAYAQVIALTSILTYIFSLGLQGSLIRFAQYDDLKTPVLYSSVLLLIAVSSVIAGAGMYLLARPLSQLTLSSSGFEQLFLVGSFLVPARIFFKISESYFRSQMKTKLAIFLTTIKNYSGISGIVIALYVYHLDIVGAMITLVGIEVLFTMIIHFVVIWDVGLATPRLTIIKKSLRYGLPLAGSSLASNLSSRADRLIIGSILGPGAVGVYDIGYRISSVLMAYSQPITQAFFPEFSRLIENGEHETCGRYVSIGVRYFMTFSIPSIFGLVLINDQLVSIVADPQTASRTTLLIPTLALGITFWGLDRLYDVVLVASEKTPVVLLFRGSAAVLNVILNFILVPYLGIIGAALTTLGTYLVSSSLMYSYSNRVVPSSFDLENAAKATFASVIMYATIEIVKLEQMLAVLVVAPIIYFVTMGAIGGIRVHEIERLTSRL